MNEHDDTRTPWERAGFSHAEWHKCLQRATKIYVGAANARSAFYENLRTMTPETLKENAKRRKAYEAARADWYAVIAGDSEVVGRFHDEIEAQERK